MEMSKDLRFAMLLDCYGEFLTPHQYRLTELYYCADLSLSEIAEIVGITRQGVRDGIKRGEQILQEMEEKLQRYGKEHKVEIFEGADHSLKGTTYFQDVVAWFRQHPITPTEKEK